MEGEAHGSDNELRQQIDDLRAGVAANRADIDALQYLTDEERRRADVSEVRADHDRDRIDKLEARADVDRAIIAELEAEGMLSRQHAAHLQEALRSSRMIGAAIGIVMAKRGVGEEDAFATLSKASQDANRKVRDLAEEIIDRGDASHLPSR